MVRQAEAQDIPFLLRVLAIAADWQPGVEPRTVVDVLAASDLAHYVPDLGARDRGLVIQDEERDDVGAAWWRFFGAADPGYGFVARDVPEVTIGLLPTSRGRGLGSRLLGELIALGRIEGLPALSLSVETENFAARLYRNLGFVQVDTNGGSATMLLSLGDDA
jgi:GNAT superfamily N-acetyltransferase